MWYNHGFWGMNWIWWVIWIIIIIFWVSLWSRRGWHARDTSYDVLRKRFAKGEITKEEYQEAKRVLEDKFQKVSEDNKH